MITLHIAKLSGQIIELIHEHGRLGINEIEKMTGANRNTIKKQLANLVAQRNIVRLGKGRATWYALP